MRRYEAINNLPGGRSEFRSIWHNVIRIYNLAKDRNIRGARTPTTAMPVAKDLEEHEGQLRPCLWQKVIGVVMPSVAQAKRRPTTTMPVAKGQ